MAASEAAADAALLPRRRLFGAASTPFLWAKRALHPAASNGDQQSDQDDQDDDQDRVGHGSDIVTLSLLRQSGEISR
jgi:hypothetical protein